MLLFFLFVDRVVGSISSLFRLLVSQCVVVDDDDDNDECTNGNGVSICMRVVARHGKTT